ncbi:phytoene desaturase family protein [Chondromyces apiculatus]|nr:NAD(P)/FAD-dependent oxidoreductase [Chondromyces apiculatus]
MTKNTDVIVVGAGHNGLVAALMLAKRGLRVLVLEEKDVIGGATRTERPFAKAPGLAISSASYLVGLVPPELLQITGVELPLKRRDPHYFLPTTDGRYLLFGSDQEAMQHQFISFFSEADWRANQAMQAELAQIREDVAPTWMQEPLTIEGTAERFVRPALRQVFVDLCRKPVRDYLERFDFKSDLIKAMYATTDGFSGLNGTWDSPGTGMNFLVHNMCRLPGSDGTWMVCEGGMGTVAHRFAAAAQAAGATIETRTGVQKILVEGGTAVGVVTDRGDEIRARVVMVNADPFRMRKLCGAESFPADYNQRLDAMETDGTTFKLNLALRGLPRFTCLPEDRGQYGPTIHLLPDESIVIQSLLDSYRAVQEGRLPEFPTVEWYIHTAIDPSMRDAEGHHNAALFVQWVPYTLKEGTWDEQETRYAKHLLSICDRFAPGTSDLVVDMYALHPRRIEEKIGIHRGHIHHVDNRFGFADRVPYRQPIAGLYSASAGTHPAGSVIGCAGHNAAMCALRDLGSA